MQDETFFNRNDSLKTFYTAINGSLTDETLLNKGIEHFRDFDNKARIVNEIEKKYGKAYWDISFVLKDFNGLRTVVTPIINSAGTVTVLIFSSERNSDYTWFRVIDKQTKQTHLSEYGDRNATLFTQYTLNGLFGATQNNYIYAKNSIKNIQSGKQLSTNSIGANTFMMYAITTCWSYGWEENGVNVIDRVQCSTSYTMIDDGTGSGSGTGLGSTTPVYSGGGSSSTGSINTSPSSPVAARLVTYSPNIPITDIKTYMKCFNSLAAATLTIYVAQPTPGSRDAHNGTNVGHSFISISQQNANGQTIIRTLGFYPNGSGNPITPTKPSILGDDGDHIYNVSYTINLSPGQFYGIYGFIMDYQSLNGGNYDLNTYNCTNFAHDIAGLAGLTLPYTTSSWPLGGGMDPGDFGEDLLKYYGNGSKPAQLNTGGANAPIGSGSCN